MRDDRVYMEIVAESSVTVLPRIMQVLSRRGFLVEELSTELIPGGMCKMNCAARGPVRWHKSIPGLIAKLIDVRSVESSQESA